MTLTVDLLRTWFGQFNAAYFGGVLPMPRLALSGARTRLGTMACKCTRRLTGCVYSDFVIRLSTYYEQTEREYQQTLLHEMIHYYIAYNRLPDTSAHGSTFRAMMRRLNSQYGWHITVSSTVRMKPAAAPAAVVHTYVVLALVLANGDRMLSVVSPRAARKVDLMARCVKAIADHRWYMTQDSYFGDFPKVRTLRARRVAKEVFNEKTAAMQPLVLK